MAGVKIIGLGKAQGDETVTNDDMGKIVDTSDEWIRGKTGIRSRYFAREKDNKDMAIEAARKAIKASGVSREEIGICIVATFTPDDYTPAVATRVAGALNLPKSVMAFDLNGACTGFIFGCSVANGLMMAGESKYALVIGSEKISPFMDMEDRGTCVLFGDGAGAAVLEQDPLGEFHFVSGCDANKDILYCNGKEGKIRMSGQEVYRFAVSMVPKCIKETMEKACASEEDIDYFVCHQANERIVDNAARRISKNKEKFFKNMYSYGNTSAASIPIALCEMMEENKFKDKSKVICTGFGAGLTYASMYIKVERKINEA